MQRNRLGQFVRGTHWRTPQVFRDANWLRAEYVGKSRSAGEIAAQFGVTDSAIYFWLHKHRIPRRTISQARSVKHWGVYGLKNPMYGRVGVLNPRWDGGHSPERQSAYARSAWKELAKSVLKRDSYKCRKCGSPNTVGLEVHHIKPWSRYPELRFDLDNLLTLCKPCHKNEHRTRNK